MVQNVNIKTSIKDYKNDRKKNGKVAIYDIDKSTVICEGDEEDWLDLRLRVEKANTKNEVYHLIIVPDLTNQIRAFDWR